jgi:hypothetical protein
VNPFRETADRRLLDHGVADATTILQTTAP